MRVNFVDTSGLVGGFSIKADSEDERAILSLFIRASENGYTPCIHSSVYQRWSDDRDPIRTP